MNFIQRHQPVISWVNEIDRFFDRSLHSRTHAAAPRESIHESDAAWILRLDLPGFSKSDVALTLVNRTLQLVAESSADQPFGGKVERHWKLGEGVDGTAVAAKLENGVLELTIPKKPKVVNPPTRIDIH